MTQRQYAMVVLVAAASGLLGGALAGWLLSGEPALAQQRNRLRAEEFLLIDRSGRTRAGMGLDANGELGFVLTDKVGNRSLYISPDESQVLRLKDKDGRILWAAP
jgi:hypothetical protein